MNWWKISGPGRPLRQNKVKTNPMPNNSSRFIKNAGSFMFFRLLLILLTGTLFASPNITRVEPPNWWIGMKWNTVQLFIYGEKLSGGQLQSADPAIEVLSTTVLGEGAYLCSEIVIPENLSAGQYLFFIDTPGGKDSLLFPIENRPDSQGRYNGFDNSDVIYLIMPDRFSNGNPDNDNVEGMGDEMDRSRPWGRHGGDLQGIINKLDYLAELGVTAIWINPLVENRMRVSYHGYAVTDMYNIDARFGDNDLYAALVAEAHKRGLKVIMDHVTNHIGRNHPWMEVLPQASWIHDTRARHPENHHRKEAILDCYADPDIRANLQDAWFVGEMPDLNQQNPLLADYIIQNTLWWIEFAGIDGIREDTYPYADPVFLARWAGTILEEYPGFNIVGEVWKHEVAFLAPFQAGSALTPWGDSHLPSVTDFALLAAFGRVFINNENIYQLYNVLSKDFLYPNPSGLLTFLDNHDVMRAWDLAGNDLQRYKFALELLFTLRGIPQIYYGTEIGMGGEGSTDHSKLRKDFPGGFPGDERDAFSASGRTGRENGIYHYLQQLIRLRRAHSALQSGKTTHLPPRDYVYVFFRADSSEQILVLANNNRSSYDFPLDRIGHHLEGRKSLTDLQNGEVIPVAKGGTVPLPESDARIFQIR
jgi:glycosidase